MMITFKGTLENGKDALNARCSYRRMEDAIISPVNAGMNFALFACLVGEMNTMNVWKACIIGYFWKKLMIWVVFLHLCVYW